MELDNEEPEKKIVAGIVIEHLNKVTKAAYRPKAKSSTAPVLARLNEGFTIQDMFDVIDAMAGKWLGNETMERYLRPSTLFGGKFESYLQEARRRSRPAEPQQKSKSGFRKGLLDDDS